MIDRRPPTATQIREQFGRRSPHPGFAIAYNVSTSIFGGTAPAVNEWLTNRTGDVLFPAYYMMTACVIGALALMKVPETTRCPINGTVTPGTDDAPDPVPYQKI